MKYRNLSKMETGNYSLITELPLKKRRNKKRRNKGKRKLSSSIKKMVLGHHDVNSFMQELSQNRTVVCSSPDKSDKSNKSFNQTIDLCADDSSIDTVNSVNLQNEPPQLSMESSVVIDLSKDVPDPDVVVITDNSIKKNLEMTVIDLSEDESIKSVVNNKSDNDDILVIGTFSNSLSPKKFHRSTQLPDFIPLSGHSKMNNIKNRRMKRNLLRKQLFWGKQNKTNLEDICDNKLVNLHESLDKNDKDQPANSLAYIGENIYATSVALPKTGLRPIIIDGSNVAYGNSTKIFSVKRLDICIKYFKEKGHKVTAFLPQFRIKNGKSDNCELLKELVRKGDVILTPSKRVDGKSIVPYDDRFIVQTAVLKGGIIVSRDNYADLLKENPAWGDTIKYRTLAFTWVDDLLMFPKDPLGEHGPTLEQFLKFD